MHVHVLTTLLYLGVLQHDLAHEPAVREALWQLLKETRYGFAATEEALFIVRERDGRLSFVRWPSLRLPHRTQWNGVWPRGVVAVAHTHPNWDPQPSRIDAGVALRSARPVYVVTRMRITKTSGRETRAVVQGDWRP